MANPQTFQDATSDFGGLCALIWIKAKALGQGQSLENSFDAGEPTMIDTKALAIRGSIPRTAALLSGVTAAFLWLWVFMLEASRQSAGRRRRG
jgi:hypothetical protein